MRTSLCVLVVCVCLGCGKGPAGDLPYETLESRATEKGSYIVSVLVSEGAAKSDVVALAKSLRREFAGKRAAISIFDAREAWQRRSDKTYPEKELSRHWLMVIDSEAAVGPANWVAEGR